MPSTSSLQKDLNTRVLAHLNNIYPEQDCQEISSRLLSIMELDAEQQKPRWLKNNWSEKDVAIITYANSFIKKDEAPLLTLDYFLTRYFSEKISWVHILPFFHTVLTTVFRWLTIDRSMIVLALGNTLIR